MGPALLARVAASAGWPSASEGPSEPIAWVLLFILTTVGVAAMIRLFGPGETEAPSRWWSLPATPLIVMLALGGAVAINPLPGVERVALLVVSRLGLTLAPLGAMLFIVTDTLRRTDLSTPHFTIRVVGPSVAVALLGVWATWLEPLAPASGALHGVEHAAMRAVDAFTVRAFCGFVAAGCLGAGLCIRALHRGPRGLLPLLGFLFWWAAYASIDALAVRIASSFERSISDMTSLALADVVATLGWAAAMTAWALSALACVPRSGRATGGITWRGVSSLALIALLAASPAFEPTHVSSPRQAAPDPLWEEVEGFEALQRPGHSNIDLLRTRRLGTRVGLLSATGELWLVDRNGATRLGENAELRMSSRVFELLVDRRATMEDLARAARRLAGVETLRIVFRTPTPTSTARGRERWSFLELASRAVSGRWLRLHEQTGDCEANQVGTGAHRTRTCMLPSGEYLAFVEPAEGTTVGAWIEATPSASPLLALAIPPTPEGGADFRWTGTRPVDSRQWRVLPVDAPLGVALGALGALLLIGLGLRREWSRAASMRAGAVSTEATPTGEAARVYPRWVRAELARHRPRPSGDGPYRGTEVSDVRVADRATSASELKRWVWSALRRGAGGLLQAALLAVLASALGLALASLV